MPSLRLTASMLCVVVLAVVGCANVPTTRYVEAAPNFSKLSATDGRIFVYRSSSFGFMVRPAVYLNGEEVGTATPGQVFFLDRPPGSYSVVTSTEVERKATFTLAPGEHKYVRLAPSFGLVVGRINPELVNREEAEEELKELDFVTPVRNK